MDREILIRADASPAIGTGHLMRCLALALAARELGIRVRLIARLGVPWVQERLMHEDVALTEVPEEMPVHEQPEALLAQLANEKKTDGERGWVVLDGYHFGLDCQQAVRAAGFKLLVIDDYAHLSEYSCDILLNQNIGAEELAYKGDIGQKLLGSKYALLRPEFLVARTRAEERQLPEKAKIILLTLGGSDISKHLAHIVPNFSIPELEGCIVRVIAGTMPPERISESFQGCPAKVEIVDRVDDMPTLLLNTDLCVTAGGSTCWELCCLGIPFLTVEIAENQRSIIQHLANFGIADMFSGNSFAIALKTPFNKETTSKLKALVDGKGCQKTLAVIANFPDLILRKAQPEDYMLVFALANDVKVRENAFSSSRITEEDHVQWYDDRLKVEDSPFYLAFSNNEFVGYVRYDKTEVRGEQVVTIAITEQWRGKRIATWLLRESAKSVFAGGADSIVAWVKPENSASQRAFQKAGYVFLGQKQYRERTMCCFQLRAK